MRKAITILVLAVSFGLVGCHKNTVTAPLPTGARNTLDAWAYRIISDSQASLTTVKTWEQCSASGNPATVSVDGKAQPCDPSAGAFPIQYKSQLNLAITAWDAASAIGKAYHDGTSNDAAGLTTAVNQLATTITGLLSQIGAK
jgi:hypothetical protein